MGIIGSGHSCGAAPMCAKSERPQGTLAAARARKARALAAARARKAWQRKARTRKAWQRKARERKVTDLVAKLIDLNCRGDNFN
jgi:membrane protein involved in colicin uptake